MTPRLVVLLLLAPLLPDTLHAQLPGCWVRGDRAEAAHRPSPLDSAEVSVGGGLVKICFGKPSARGRTMIGGVERYGEPWRLGANEATTLHVTVPVAVAGVSLVPGSYSLYAIPSSSTWTLVLNRAWERWGIPLSPEVRAQDVGEALLTPERLAEPVETLRFSFAPTAGGVDLLMEWEGSRLRIPVTPGG
jgi:hypothetical protein